MTWLGLYDHDAQVERFRSSLQRGRLGSTYFFAGPAGVGKFTFAKQLAQSLLCVRRDDEALDPCGECPACQQVAALTHPDFLVVRRPENRSTIPIESFIGPRERRMQEGLCAWIGIKPTSGGRRVAIIDDADYLAPDAANSLLKTLEEPPPKSLLILVGTNPDYQLPTIRSRCQIVHFRALRAESLELLIPQLGLAHEASRVPWISRAAQGSLAVAAEMADPSLAEFRRDWLASLSEPEPLGTQLSAMAFRFCEAAGKEAGPKRDRLIRLCEMTADFFRDAMRQTVGVGPVDDPEEGSWLDAMTRTHTDDPETWGACAVRCLDAVQHLESNAHLQNALDALISDLLQILAEGPDSLAATHTYY